MRPTIAVILLFIFAAGPAFAEGERQQAARGIGFEPAARGGTPFSVTKIIEYTFTLY